MRRDSYKDMFGRNACTKGKRLEKTSKQEELDMEHGLRGCSILTFHLSVTLCYQQARLKDRRGSKFLNRRSTQVGGASS
jgi:hypothetical protein